MKTISPMSYAARGLTLPPVRPELKAMRRRAHGGEMRIGAASSVPAWVTGAGAYQTLDALKDSDARSSIPYYSMQGALQAVVSTLNRERMAGLGSYLFDNNGRVFQAVSQIADYCAPILPQAASDDAEANKEYDAYFDAWTKRADFTGRFSYWMLQRLQVIAALVHGDIGKMFTVEAGFPQIQLIECFRIRDDLMRPNVIDGVEIDKFGRVTGYVLDGSTVVPASQFMLAYNPERYARYRGLSPFRRGSNDIRDFQDIKGFSKLGVKLWTALCAVIEGGPLEEDVWGNDSGSSDGATEGNAEAADDATVTQAAKKMSVAELLGGDIPTLPAGQTLRQLSNSQPGDRVPEFMLSLVGDFVSGLGYPPSFFLDEKATGPNTRAVNGKAQRQFDKVQDLNAAGVEWDWLRVIGFGIANDGLPSAPNWDRIEWQGPPKISIDEGRDSESWRQDFNLGLRSRQNIFSMQQLSWKRELDHAMAEDDYLIERCQERAKRFGLPVDTLLSRVGIVGKPTAAPTQPAAVGGGGEGQAPGQENPNVGKTGKEGASEDEEWDFTNIDEEGLEIGLRDDDGTQARDENGRWTANGGGVGLKRDAKGKKWVREDGSPMPKHAEKLRIPPAWKNVRVAPDGSHDLQAIGTDEKGRVQRIYSDSFTMKQAAAKFARNKEMIRKERALVGEIREDTKAPHREISEPAKVMAVIHSTGIRPGSTKDTGGDKQAYGASTLEGRHVVETKSGLALKFTGKKGVSLNIPVKDEFAAKILRDAKRKAGERGKLFDQSLASDQKLRDYCSVLGEGKFHPKDFRTLKGTKAAMELASKESRASSQKEYKKKVMGIAKAVAEKLGNTPSIALKSYINPFVFESIKPARL